MPEANFWAVLIFPNVGTQKTSKKNKIASFVKGRKTVAAGTAEGFFLQIVRKNLKIP